MVRMLWPCVRVLALVSLICQLAGNGWAQTHSTGSEPAQSSSKGQAYPVKPVRLIVPTSPGSGFDVIGRIVAGGLTEVLGQQVIVENRVGAAANIGAEAAARASADGYTLLEVSATHVVNRSLYRNLSYDLVRDFAPVTQLASSPSVLVVHPSLPVKSIGDFVKLAKAKPGAINYASTGVGSATFMPAELFKASNSRCTSSRRSRSSAESCGICA